MILADELLSSLPPEWPEDLLPRIQDAVRSAGTKVIVLDDDPTGCQTVHDVDVLTQWSVPTLSAALRDPDPVVYLITNTRSLPLPRAQELNREIARNLTVARAATGRPFALVSRSDSTLRGHYPGEIQALANALGMRFDATLVVPFFLEGGRITIQDTHYVTEGDRLIPAADTEYARDPVFGYASANLRAWVSERYAGSVSQEDVASITLEDVRVGGPDAVCRRLLSLGGSGRDATGQPCIVNAASYRDIEVVVAGALAAEAQGCRLLYRTAASFVRVRGGIAPHALLTPEDLRCPEHTGGLVIIGSYVGRTTRQTSAALDLPCTDGIELPVATLTDPAQRSDTVVRVAREVNRALRHGRVALLYTSRDVITDVPHHTSLDIGQLISGTLIDVVNQVERRPRWIIAKGGVTSSDIATRALRIARARVLGQAIPGIPVWRTGPESRWPGLTYVVFPGNVGDDDALARMIGMLR